MCETIFSFDGEKGLCYDTGRECPVGTLTELTARHSPTWKSRISGQDPSPSMFMRRRSVY